MNTTTNTYNKDRVIQLGDYLFDPESYHLWRDGSLVSPELTSTEANLLIYLYENRDRIISRDELLEHVSSSRVVSETIVTQYIKTLRKVLGDDARKPAYIRTHQKQGYQFIAKVSPVEPASKKPWLPVSLAIVVLACAAWVFYAFRTTTTLQNLPVPLTSLYGYELYGTTSPDRDYILFSHLKHNPGATFQLVLKPLDQEKYYQLTDEAANHMNADISHKGDRVAYQVYNETINEIRVSDINWQTFQLENTRRVVELPVGQNTANLSWKDDNHIYYSNPTAGTPGSIKLRDIEQGTDIIITSPEANGAGDLTLSYSPVRGRLAFIRNYNFSKSEIYTYDEDSNSLTLHASVPEEPLTIDWTTDGQLIIKDKQSSISLLDLQTGQLTPVVINRDAVFSPFNLDQNHIAYTSGDFVSYDILSRRLDLRDKAAIVTSSSFNDYRAAVADDVDTIAFISNRSGINQIWIKEASGELRQVTEFEDYYTIDHLAISPDGTKIAYTTDAAIQVIDSYTGNIIGTISGDDKGYIDPAFNADSSKLFYTYFANNTWYIESLYLEEFALKTVLTKGYLAKPCPVGDCYYYLRLSDKALMKRTGLEDEIDTGIRLPDVGFLDQFQVINGSVYYTKREGETTILYRHDFNAESPIEVMPVDAIHFDINSKTNMIYYLSRQPFDTNIEKLRIATPQNQ